MKAELAHLDQKIENGTAREYSISIVMEKMSNITVTGYILLSVFVNTHPSSRGVETILD